MLTEAYNHVEHTWDHVLAGHSTTNEKLEVAAEAGLALAAAAGCAKLGLANYSSEVQAALPELLINDARASLTSTVKLAVAETEATISHTATATAPNLFRLPKPSIDVALTKMSTGPEPWVDESKPLTPGWHASHIPYAVQGRLRSALGMTDDVNLHLCDIWRLRQPLPKGFPVPGETSVIETEPAFLKGFEKYGLVRKLTVDFTGRTR